MLLHRFPFVLAWGKDQNWLFLCEEREESSIDKTGIVECSKSLFVLTNIFSSTKKVVMFKEILYHSDILLYF